MAGSEPTGNGADVLLQQLEDYGVECIFAAQGREAALQARSGATDFVPRPICSARYTTYCRMTRSASMRSSPRRRR